MPKRGATATKCKTDAPILTDARGASKVVLVNLNDKK